VQIPGGEVGVDGKRQATYETALLRSGHKYFFKVRSRTSWWAASADSNIVSFVWHIPAKAPIGVRASASDSRVDLSWQPVTLLIDGEPMDAPLRYQVLRSGDSLPFIPLGEPVSETSFADQGVANGKTYQYKVQSVVMVEDNPVGGGISEPVSATPVDLTAPAPVVGVTAVQTANGIKIFWDKSPEADVQGYRVYRRGENESEASLIGEVQAVYTIYEDVTVPAEGSFYYSVTAFDKMEQPNESERSREAGIRH